MPDNLIDGLRHAVTRPFVLDHSKLCNCKPLDESKAMCGDDVLRIFKPLPEDEAAFMRKYVGKAERQMEDPMREAKNAIAEILDTDAFRTWGARETAEHLPRRLANAGWVICKAGMTAAEQEAYVRDHTGPSDFAITELGLPTYAQLKRRVTALEGACDQLMLEYEQGQFPDNHPHHRLLWDALRVALTGRTKG